MLPVSEAVLRPTAVPRTTSNDPILAAQHTFRTLLGALAAPGQVLHLDIHPAVSRAGSIGNPWLASALLTLIDHEVSLAVAPSPAAEALGDFLYRRTRTPLVPMDQADFIAASLATFDPGTLDQVKRGSLEYPDDSVTLVLLVDSLVAPPDPAATFTVSGPGVNGSRQVVLPGMPDAFLAARDRVNRHYPMGIDCVFIDDSGRVIALPRTSTFARQQGDA